VNKGASHTAVNLGRPEVYRGPQIGRQRQVAEDDENNWRGPSPFYQTWDWHCGKRANSG